jgi:hypothetical protein
MGTLLDSSVLIGLERTGSSLALPDDEEVGIAAITASELLHGVHRADPPRRAQREAFVEHVLRVLPVYPFSLDSAPRACTAVGRPGDGGSPHRTARSVARGDSTGSRLVRRHLQRERIQTRARACRSRPLKAESPDLTANVGCRTCTVAVPAATYIWTAVLAALARLTYPQRGQGPTPGDQLRPNRSAKLPMRVPRRTISSSSR